MSRVDLFLDRILGEDFCESLAKTEIWKPGTKSVLDHHEIFQSLQIVPRTIIALLIRELAPMHIGETKEIILPVSDSAMMRVTKHERDQYSGEIEEDNKKITEFKLRSLPGVGLIIMSAFELYDMDSLINSHEDVPVPAKSIPQPTPTVNPNSDDKIQRLIDERLMLHELIGKVVDKKIMEKEAIHQMVMAKLTEAVSIMNDKSLATHAMCVDQNRDLSTRIVKLEEERIKEAMGMGQSTPKKKRPLEKFLEERSKPKEFTIQMTKGEAVSCPDCGKEIFSKSGFSGCICYGPDMSKKVFLKKTENGIKVSFPKSWDVENIEMLLEVLQRKNK